MAKIYLEGLDNLKQDIIKGVADLLDAQTYKQSLKDGTEMDLRQASKKVGLKPETLRLKASKGQINHKRSNGESGKYLFSNNDIKDFLENRKGVSKRERTNKFRESIELEISKQFKK